jgi:ankyrin repeat protein
VQNGQEEVVEILLSSCKDLTIPDDTLHMASKLADIRVATNIAKLLLKAGARADAVNEKLDQALHESCRRKGGKMLVSMLLTAGGNASAINAQGHTPLHISAFTGDVEITQELLCHLCQDPGINTHPLGPENQTPLHIAVSKGHVKCASLLATSKLIDVCARTSAGKTAFELSVTKGSAAITSMLVRAGGANLPLSEMQRIIQIIQSREIKPEDYDLLLALDAATDMATLETSVTPAFPVRQLEQTDSAVGAACMICLETMAASHSVSVLPCKHHFHSDCITEYLRTKIRSKVCPCCSHNLAAGDV